MKARVEIASVTRFVTDVKRWLEARKEKFVTIRSGSGGCPTCGWGAEEIEEIDFQAMLKEIDVFGDSLRKQGVK